MPDEYEVKMQRKTCEIQRQKKQRMNLQATMNSSPLREEEQFEKMKEANEYH